jgi:hypothetical protein
MLPSSRVTTVWVRALVLCDDVRLEVGGTMTLVGVYADRIIVQPSDGELVIPKLAIYSVVAGLTGSTELKWRHALSEAGREPGQLIAQGNERHDSDADEHRIIHIVSPLWLPGPGRYKLSVDFETPRARRTVEHHFEIETAEAPPPEPTKPA